MKPQDSNIAFIGYRACGKTSLAGMVGKTLVIPVVDSDILIEQRTGKTIAEIFVNDGESAFREHEAAVIAEIFTSSPIILATGGGAILRESNREILRKNSFVIWLKATPATIFERMTVDPMSGQRRPNLTGLPPLEEIENLLEFRTPIYSELADLVLETDSKSVDELHREILESLPSRQ